MAKDLEKALVNQEAKLKGVKKPHMDLGAHLEYIESLLEGGGSGSGGGSEGGSGGGSGGGSVDLLKPILTEGKAPVPNTGYVEKIFFNTKLTTDEVDALIANANLPFIDDGAVHLYPILGSEAGSKAGILFVIMDFSSSIDEAGSSWAIANLTSETFFYTSSSVAADFGLDAGWNASSFTSFDTGEVTVNGDLVDTIQGINLGTANNLLTNLIYLPELVDSGETEVAKSLTGQYKIVEKNLKLDTESNASYTYDFINSINEDTKEIRVIKNIEVDPWQEVAIISGSITTYTNDKVITVGPYAFYHSAFLSDFSFPKAKTIKEWAFGECQKLTNVNLPSVKTIERYAFYNCRNLTNASFPQANTLGAEAFSGCNALVNIDIPLVTGISNNAFQYCNYLVNINLPSVTNIDTGAFADCGLISATLPEVTIISVSAFANNYKLTEVYAPKVTRLDSKAFSNCYSLIKLFISQKDSVCTLSLRADDIFHDCSHILGVQNSTYNPNGLKDGYIYVPASLLSQYKATTNWTFCDSQIIGHEDLEAGASLPNYTTDSFTTQTWYSDEKLTNVVTEVATSGTYYCRLEA